MAAGLVPKEPQYGDQTNLRRLGLKASPVSGTPTFFNPQGGRPPKVPQAGAQAPALSGPQAAPPPAPGITAEHRDLYQRASDLSNSARVWAQLAQSQMATPRIQRIAMALKEAARIAILDARHQSPYTKGM